MEITKQELEQIADRLLKSNKPKMIVASFTDKDINKITESKTQHFKTAEYLWQGTPHNKEGNYKGMHMGLLLDENLNYVHIVFASKNFMEWTFELARNNN
jgi:hypothetical protein